LTSAHFGAFTPSPAGEGWGDDCMDAGGRAPTVGASPNAPTVGRRRMEQLPRRFKNQSLNCKNIH